MLRSRISSTKGPRPCHHRPRHLNTTRRRPHRTRPQAGPPRAAHAQEVDSAQGAPSRAFVAPARKQPRRGVSSYVTRRVWGRAGFAVGRERGCVAAPRERRTMDLTAAESGLPEAVDQLKGARPLQLQCCCVPERSERGARRHAPAASAAGRRYPPVVRRALRVACGRMMTAVCYPRPCIRPRSAGQRVSSASGSRVRRRVTQRSEAKAAERRCDILRGRAPRGPSCGLDVAAPKCDPDVRGQSPAATDQPVVLAACTSPGAVGCVGRRAAAAMAAAAATTSDCSAAAFVSVTGGQRCSTTAKSSTNKSIGSTAA